MGPSRRDDTARLRALAALDEELARDATVRAGDMLRHYALGTVEVTEPMLLVAQVQRSGGTLLTRLFDAHPQIRAYPLELYWGRPDELHWPDVDPAPDSPESMFVELAAGNVHQIRRFNRDGYGKFGRGGAAAAAPFAFSLALQREVFLAAAPFASRRAALDAFLGAFFTAWLDYQSRYGEPRRFVSAFGKRHNFDAARGGFFRDYPDGRMITIVRDPGDWLASASVHDPREYGDLDRAVDVWCTSTRASIEARRERPEQVRLVEFDTLAAQTEAVMRSVAAWAGLRWDVRLLTPTFNGLPIASNSSFAPSTAIDPAVLSRSESTLDPAARARVRAVTRELLREARSFAGTDGL